MGDVTRATKAVEAHLKWKRENCDCEDVPADEIPLEEPKEEEKKQDPVETTSSDGVGRINPGTFSGGGFGDVVINADGSGTYSGTWDKSALGEILFRFNGGAGTYSGLYAESAVGEHGVLENIVVSDDGNTIEGTYRSTAHGDRAGASGLFQLVRKQ